jgi:hypothetical protein
MEFVVEVQDEEMVHKVDEGISHVSRILEVNGEVEEIVFPLVALVNLLQEHLLIIFIRNIPDHYGSPQILALFNLFDIKLKHDHILARE